MSESPYATVNASLRVAERLAVLLSESQREADSLRRQVAELEGQLNVLRADNNAMASLEVPAKSLQVAEAIGDTVRVFGPAEPRNSYQVDVSHGHGERFASAINRACAEWAASPLPSAPPERA